MELLSYQIWAFMMLCASAQRYTVLRNKNGDSFSKNNTLPCSTYQAVADTSGECLCRNNDKPGTLLGNVTDSLKCFYTETQGTGCRSFIKGQEGLLSTFDRPSVANIGLLSFPSGLTFFNLKNIEYWDGFGWLKLSQPQLRITPEETPGNYLLTWSSQPRNINWDYVYKGRVVKINMRLLENNADTDIREECVALKFAGQRTIDAAYQFTIPPATITTISWTQPKTTTTSTITIPKTSTPSSTNQQTTASNAPLDDNSGDDDGGGGGGAIVGTIVALIVIIIIIIGGIIFYRKKKNLKPLFYFNCCSKSKKSSKPHLDVTIERIVEKDLESRLDYVVPLENQNAYEDPKFIIESRNAKRKTAKQKDTKIPSPKKNKEPSQKEARPKIRPKKRESQVGLMNMSDVFYVGSSTTNEEQKPDNTPTKKQSISIVQEEEGIYNDPLYQANVVENENAYIVDMPPPLPPEDNKLKKIAEEESDQTDNIVETENNYEQQDPAAYMYESLRIFQEDYIDNAEINVENVPPRRPIESRSRSSRPSLQALVSSMDDI